MKAKRIALLGSPQMRQSITVPQSAKNVASDSSVTCSSEAQNRIQNPEGFTRSNVGVTVKAAMIPAVLTEQKHGPATAW
jgi:hypothetical protein